jgi:pyruvate dehydrogenase phosphatase
MLGPLLKLLSGCGGVWPTSPAPDSTSSGGDSEGRDGLLWWRDLARCHAGEVSIAVAQANQVLEDQCRLESIPPLSTVVGIFDGHGGHDAARFAWDHLFPNLRGNPNLNATPPWRQSRSAGLKLGKHPLYFFFI